MARLCTSSHSSSVRGIFFSVPLDVISVETDPQMKFALGSTTDFMISRMVPIGAYCTAGADGLQPHNKTRVPTAPTKRVRRIRQFPQNSFSKFTFTALQT